MEKMDNNKTKKGLIKKPTTFSFFRKNTLKVQTNQKQSAKKLQTNQSLILSTERFCKSLSLSATQPQNKTEKQHFPSPVLLGKTKIGGAKELFNKPFTETFYRLGLEGEGKAKMQLEELKKKFVNLLMRNGEKSKAYKLFAESLKQLEQEKTKTTYLEIFDFFNAQKILQQEKFQKSSPLEGLLKSSFAPPIFVLPSKTGLGDQGQQVYTSQKQLSDKKKITNKKVEIDSYNSFLKNSTLYQAVENVKPILELRRVRKRGTTYQVPAIVSQKRQERLAIKWIIESAEKRKKKNKNSFSNCLVSEILDAFNKTGQPRQRRDEQLKVAEFNRAYTRYRWW